ncbi:Adenosine deaminase 2 [Fusarium oxysporum f. sp. albedinis]|nr:Adenosine deaminase 2 [Fusarium oxysporum f. sp. albedinis]
MSREQGQIYVCVLYRKRSSMTESTARTQIAHGKVHKKAELSLSWHFLVLISISKRPCIHIPTPEPGA